VQIRDSGDQSLGARLRRRPRPIALRPTVTDHERPHIGNTASASPPPRTARSLPGDSHLMWGDWWWPRRARAGSCEMRLAEAQSRSPISGKTGNRRHPAPRTRFPTAAMSRFPRTTGSTSRTRIERQNMNPRYRCFHVHLRAGRHVPHQPRDPFHATLAIVRQGRHQPCHRFHTDNRGFVFAVSGLRQAGLGSFRKNPPSRCRIDCQIGSSGFVSPSSCRRAHLPIRQVASFHRFRIIGSPANPAKRSGRDDAWNHRWPPDGRSPSHPRRPSGWVSVPGPIARLVQIDRSNCQRSRGRQSTVLNPGTRSGKGKRCPGVLVMIGCAGRKGSVDGGDSGRRGGRSCGERRGCGGGGPAGRSCSAGRGSSRCAVMLRSKGGCVRNNPGGLDRGPVALGLRPWDLPPFR
jgi:hypothetical protein